MPEEVDLSSLYSLMRPKKVCLCMSVTEAEIVSAIQQGADSLEKISDETFAATNCGTCSGQILMILQRELKNKKTT